MHVKMTVCDSGGERGFTKQAYDFYRRLRDKPEYSGLHSRFLLVKGASAKEAPLMQLTYPDSNRKDRNAGARGDVPVMRINSNMVKDAISQMLEREEEGGRVTYPGLKGEDNEFRLGKENEGFKDAWYEELCAEERNMKGQWENKKQKRNETFDTLCYAWVLNRYTSVRGDRIDWKNPPSWADEWEVNDLVARTPDAKFSLETQKKVDFSSFGKSLGS
jgi:phage terminase large subunit GpA-like protein